jgi:hypothetical protein
MGDRRNGGGGVMAAGRNRFLLRLERGKKTFHYITSAYVCLRLLVPV